MTTIGRVDGNRPWAPIVGYSRAVRMGNLVEVSGTSSTTRDGTVMFPLVFDSGLLLQTLLLASLTGLLSAFAPALRAARLDPVVAIRG